MNTRTQTTQRIRPQSPLGVGVHQFREALATQEIKICENEQ